MLSAWSQSLERLAVLGGPFLWLLALVGIVAWTAIVEAALVCWSCRGRLLSERLAARLWLLRILAAVAPLLGLLGTVSGIIVCFGDLGSSSGRHLASGIAESLLCTAAGLVVAIPAAVAYAILTRHAAAADAEPEQSIPLGGGVPLGGEQR